VALAAAFIILIGLATVTGCVGGIYGIGGGAILSPILIGSGRPAAEVAPVPAERAELSTCGSQVKMIWPPAAMA
jgi:uncharacterized membrane protein YfcA